MDKITSITNTDIPSSNYSSILSNSNSDSNSNISNSFWDGIKNINFLTGVIIILVFALLGFNIFVYLGIATQDITSFFKPLIVKIYEILGLTTKNIVNVGLEDSKSIVTGTANVYDKTATTIQNNIDSSSTNLAINSSTAKTSISNDKFPSSNISNDISESNTLNKALNTAAVQQAGSNKTDYEADESTSTIQRGAASKSGWCFIGEDRGFRTCAQVGVNDTCMSGDIFPSNEICINPKLRP
jgi:hypothetical protein